MTLPSPAASDPTANPDVLTDAAGRRIMSAAQWPARRTEIIDRLLPVVYGPMPPAPDMTRCELLHAAPLRRFGGATLLTCRVRAAPGQSFAMRVFLPAGDEAVPVVVNGDGCWHYASDEVIAALIGRHYGFAQFNRVELAADPPGPDVTQPASGGSAAIAWWAWGFHRAIDALGQLARVDRRRLAVVGHSRGGKAAVLAGALDERIAVTSANNSGCGGAGSFQRVGPGAETLADITRAFPHWFAPELARYAGREQALPFDQHLLKALVAPRGLLTTEALGDLWANPAGTWHTHRAAQRAFELLGAGDAIAVAWRQGGHEHRLEDWLCLLDFCDHRFRGAARPAALDRPPLE